jgi:branched-chain amino acid transport system ATP-binding protein
MALLHLENLTKNFEGVLAVDELSFDVQEGEIAGLIGPNGSGKTTTLNLVTGFHEANGGTVTFDGHDITNAKPYKVASYGVGRTFQLSKPFGRLSVAENMLVPNVKGLSREERDARIDRILNELELAHVSAQRADQLSGGQKKLLELARVLMLEPDLILLDEPAAGVNPALMDDIIDTIKMLNDRGRTFLVIEHDMSVIENLCDRVIVMNAGSYVTSGTFEEIQRDEEVREAYLGGA